MRTKFITSEGYNSIENLRQSKKSKKSNKKLITAGKQASTTGKDISNNAKSIAQALLYHCISCGCKVSKVFTKTKCTIKNALKELKRLSVTFIKSLTPKKVLKNFVLPASAVAVLVLTVCFWTHLNYGLSVKYGNNTATIKNEAIFQKANEMVNNNIAVTPTTARNTSAEYSLTILNLSSEQPASENELYENIVNTDGTLVSGYGFYLDNEFIGATEDSEQLYDALDSVLLKAREKYDEGTTTEFANKIYIEQGIYPVDAIVSANDIISKSSKSFSIELNTDVVHKYDVDFDTEYKYDDSKYEDYEKVSQKGVKGVQTVTYRVSYVDGEQTDAVVISDEITTKPVNEVIVKGTKERPAEGYATGSFMWPVPYTHTITSYYGARWGTTHTGIDISSSGIYGQSIVASDGGTVTWAGYDNSGYGYYVIIDHGNGYQTLYAHCSELYVSNGQAVAKGQSIAAVGSSGDSTGSHLHFEVRSGSNRLDPMGYVG